MDTHNSFGIEVIFGGNRQRVVRYTLNQAESTARSLEAGESVLYLNTLEAPMHFDRHFSRRFGHAGTPAPEGHRSASQARVMQMSILVDDFMQKAEFIEKLVEQCGVKLVVLNNLDFAAMSGRRKCRVVSFLIRLMEAYSIRVLVHSIADPTVTSGSLRSLAFIAESVESLDRMRSTADRDDVRDVAGSYQQDGTGAEYVSADVSGDVENEGLTDSKGVWHPEKQRAEYRVPQAQVHHPVHAASY